MARGPDVLFLRLKVGVIDILDVEQQFRPDVNVYFYYKPEEKLDLPNARANVRFQNLVEHPAWKPHFDFANEVAEPMVTDESYWFDRKLGLVFGRINLLPWVQERFDHHKFPFDRQILDVQLQSNNSVFKNWDKAAGEYPMELALREDHWLVQCELSAMADAWDLADVNCQVTSDADSRSSSAHVQIFLERCSRFYVWNIGFVYFLIILAQGCLFTFPLNETRFDFAIQLALTTVAFKFVTSTQVPKTAYLTTLDSYMLWGLVLLGVRFLGDTILLTSIGEDTPSFRGNCDFDALTECEADLVLTIALTGLWAVSSVVYLFFGSCLLRPPWTEVNRLLEAGAGKSRVEYEVLGKGNVAVNSVSFAGTQELFPKV